MRQGEGVIRDSFLMVTCCGGGVGSINGVPSSLTPRMPSIALGQRSPRWEPQPGEAVVMGGVGGVCCRRIMLDGVVAGSTLGTGCCSSQVVVGGDKDNWFEERARRVRLISVSQVQFVSEQFFYALPRLN